MRTSPVHSKGEKRLVNDRRFSLSDWHANARAESDTKHLTHPAPQY